MKALSQQAMCWTAKATPTMSCRVCSAKKPLMIKLSLSLSVAYAGEGGGAPCAGTTAFVIAFVCCVSGALMLTVGLTLGRVCTVS